MLGYITKHLEVRQKYYARVVFLEMRSNTVFRVYILLLETFYGF